MPEGVACFFKTVCMSKDHGTDHMANERTFLAWIRTSIAIMAFGFVVERFALFVKEVAALAPHFNPQPAPAFSTVIGFVLVITGALISILAYIKFRITTRLIDNENYRPFYMFDLALTILVIIAGVLLAIYLKPF